MQVYDVFTYGLIATVSALLVIMLCTFRSIAVALRLALSICLTLCWCYGGGVIIFATGLFTDGDGPVHSLSWLGPIMSFSLVTGR